jgi:hypothetical protein
MNLDYFDLVNIYKQSLRRKSWILLDSIEKSFFKACLIFLRKFKIKSLAVIENLQKIINKIRSFKFMVIKRGKEMAMQIQNSKIAAIFPEVKSLLNDSNYIFWLGLRAIR